MKVTYETENIGFDREIPKKRYIFLENYSLSKINKIR